jgi:hypothetical protein
MAFLVICRFLDPAIAGHPAIGKSSTERLRLSAFCALNFSHICRCRQLMIHHTTGSRMKGAVTRCNAGQAWHVEGCCQLQQRQLAGTPQSPSSPVVQAMHSSSWPSSAAGLRTLIARARHAQIHALLHPEPPQACQHTQHWRLMHCLSAADAPQGKHSTSTQLHL